MHPTKFDPVPLETPEMIFYGSKRTIQNQKIYIYTVYVMFLQVI